MKISGDRGHVEVEHNGKTARFSGEMLVKGFLATATSMKWITPDGMTDASADEIAAMVKTVKRHQWKNHAKIKFVDNKGKRYKA